MKFFFRNQEDELIQKYAWRLVRSAEDRIGAGRGDEKRGWCVDRIRVEFPKLINESAEDFIRAAFMNFKIETKALSY